MREQEHQQHRADREESGQGEFGPQHRAGAGGGIELRDVGQQVNIFRPELALATLLAVIPVAIVFLLSQRALVRGMVGGAVKE